MIRGRIARDSKLNTEVVGATPAASVPSGRRGRAAMPKSGRKSRRAAALRPADEVEDARPVEDNEELTVRLCKSTGLRLPAVILLGGADLLQVRTRHAQSVARADLLPSFWSSAGVLTAGVGGLRVTQAGADGHDSLANIPGSNAVSEVPLARYKDPVAFPNIAVLEFPVEDSQKLVDGIKYLERARLALDLVGPLAHWLAYLWGVERSSNPLLAGTAEPSALFVDRVFGYAGVDVTPGLAEPVVCPEAIWQAALWWRDFYVGAGAEPAKQGRKKAGDKVAQRTGPRGFHKIRQKAAAVVEEEDRAW